MTVVASVVCSDNVALARVAALACAVALLSSMPRRTLPHRSGAQLTLPSSEPAVTVAPLPVVVVTPPTFSLKCVHPSARPSRHSRRIFSSL